MRVLAGLGNPGEEYALTRHNAGFWLVDAVADLLGAEWQAFKGGELADTRAAGERAFLFKPMQYMNRSGEPLQALLAYYKIQPADLCVAADDVYLEPGSARIRRGGADGGHNGWKSVIQHVHPDEFLRVRIGAGIYEQHPLKRAHQPSLDAYVLSPQQHSDQERTANLIDTLAPQLIEWLRCGELEETTVRTI